MSTSTTPDNHQQSVDGIFMNTVKLIVQKFYPTVETERELLICIQKTFAENVLSNSSVVKESTEEAVAVSSNVDVLVGEQQPNQSDDDVKMGDATPLIELKDDLKHDESNNPLLVLSENNRTLEEELANLKLNLELLEEEKKQNKIMEKKFRDLEIEKIKQKENFEALLKQETETKEKEILRITEESNEWKRKQFIAFEELLVSSIRDEINIVMSNVEEEKQKMHIELANKWLEEKTLIEEEKDAKYNQLEEEYLQYRQQQEKEKQELDKIRFEISQIHKTRTLQQAGKVINAETQAIIEKAKTLLAQINNSCLDCLFQSNVPNGFDHFNSYFSHAIFETMIIGNCYDVETLFEKSWQYLLSVASIEGVVETQLESIKDNFKKIVHHVIELNNLLNSAVFPKVHFTWYYGEQTSTNLFRLVEKVSFTIPNAITQKRIVSALPGIKVGESTTPDVLGNLIEVTYQ